MEATFYISALVAIVATLLAITNANPVHALLYLALSLLAVALMFYTLGAPFAAALEVIVYAGAIVVLFVFVVMMLNVKTSYLEKERAELISRFWLGPALLAAVLLAELIYLLFSGAMFRDSGAFVVEPKEVGRILFGPYLLAVELASMLLLAGLIGAYHIGRRHSEGTR